jgi:cardiolipin synthase
VFREGAIQYKGGHDVQLLSGGDQMFPSLVEALAGAQHEVWLAAYIFSDDVSGQRVADALMSAARRGVEVHVLVDGFGSKAWVPVLRGLFADSGVQLEVFRSLDRWWAWFQPQQLRRLHHKVCAVDGKIGFVGGINFIDDRFDMHHGWSDEPRLDFAVRLEGPVAQDVAQAVRALWLRAHLGRGWQEEVASLVRSAAMLKDAAGLLRQLRSSRPPEDGHQVEAGIGAVPVRAALVLRDNIRRRRAIEHSYVQAIGQARTRIDIACPYFYPGTRFRRALERAADRGVHVRLLLQGKVDYRIAALAARVHYDGMLRRGIQVFEYTPAFLHAKVAVVDDMWATVGSSNIDPLSLLLNLEANVVLIDKNFVEDLTLRLNAAFAVSTAIDGPSLSWGWKSWFMKGLISWLANLYLRLAGIARRY